MQATDSHGDTRIPDRLDRYAERRTRLAASARLDPLVTVDDDSAARALERIDDPWARRLYDGAFLQSLQSPAPRSDSPAMSLVFVQSRDGNTEADDPSELGGGDIDQHFLYEGLTRVDADLVLAGARTVGRGNLVFSVWHPELVRLRESRGRDRHPIQAVLTETGALPIETGLLFNAPGLRVLILTNDAVAKALGPRVANRPWIEVVTSGPSSDVRVHARALRERFGVERVSAIGGRTAATGLLDAGLIQDLYLTTGSKKGGKPETPFYIGKQPPRLDLIVRKQGTGGASGVVFEHFVVGRP